MRMPFFDLAHYRRTIFDGYRDLYDQAVAECKPIVEQDRIKRLEDRAWDQYREALILDEY